MLYGFVFDVLEGERGKNGGERGKKGGVGGETGGNKRSLSTLNILTVEFLVNAFYCVRFCFITSF